MDFKVINTLGETIAFVVNSKSESDAQRMAKKHEDYFDVQEIDSLNMPSMFINCLIDKTTI